jgi:hypothetical protein
VDSARESREVPGGMWSRVPDRAPDPTVPPRAASLSRGDLASVTP